MSHGLINWYQCFSRTRSFHLWGRWGAEMNTQIAGSSYKHITKRHVTFHNTITLTSTVNHLEYHMRISSSFSYDMVQWMDLTGSHITIVTFIDFKVIVHNNKHDITNSIQVNIRRKLNTAVQPTKPACALTFHYFLQQLLIVNTYIPSNKDP